MFCEDYRVTGENGSNPFAEPRHILAGRSGCSRRAVPLEAIYPYTSAPAQSGQLQVSLDPVTSPAVRRKPLDGQGQRVVQPVPQHRQAGLPDCRQSLQCPLTRTALPQLSAQDCRGVGGGVAGCTFGASR